MIIELNKLPADGAASFAGEESPDILGLAQDPYVRIKGPIRYQLTAQKVSRQLVVSGTLTLDLELECGRCAEFFSTSAAVSSFLRAYEAPESLEKVDVTPDIREDILLAIEAYPVCSDACRGLCPRCGQNLNRGPCGCRPAAAGALAWSALNKIELKK